MARISFKFYETEEECKRHHFLRDSSSNEWKLGWVVWDPTYACNQKCLHCYASAGNPLQDEMSFEEAKSLIDHIAALGITELGMAGGEILLRKDIFDIIKYAKGKGLVTHLGTNATLVDREIARKLKEAGITQIQVDICGVNPEIHDNVRGVKGAFKKTMEGIANLQKEGIRIAIATPILKYNMNEIPEIFDMAEKLGAYCFRTERLMPMGRSIEKYKKYAISTQEYLELISKLIEKSSSKEISSIKIEDPILYPNMEDFKKISNKVIYAGCEAGRSLCAVTANGEVLPCQWAHHPLMVAGNIRQKPLIEIWKTSEKFKVFRNPERIKGKCNNCNFLRQCGGGCRAEATVLSGNLNSEDPRCEGFK